MVQVAIHRTGGAVDDRRTYPRDKARRRSKHRGGHRARAMDRRPGARGRGSEVRPEDDVRVEDGKERIEVTVACRGEEGIDGSSLLRQVAIMLRRKPNSATGPAGSLLFALVIAPALATLVRSAPGLDYRTCLVVMAYAVLLLALALRVFRRAAVR